MSRLQAVLAVAAICVLTVIRIASTHRVFSPTYDEPLHVAAGHEFLAEHRYRTGTDNPPLARAVLAFPLRHARPTATEGGERIGQIFESAGDYMAGVAKARRGNLLFVVILIVGTALFAADQFGRTCGVIAAAVIAMLPPILAHGGLATTDVAGTAAFAVGLFVMSRWLERPSWWMTALLGAAVAFGLLTKFSFALFFAIGAVALMVARRRWPPLRQGALALLVALILVYGVYLSAHAGPRFLLGLVKVVHIGGGGHDAYLLGEVRHTGWWYYFPLVLAIKTPIPVLLLAFGGAWFLVREREHPEIAAMAAAILLSVLPSRANLGVRHILPIYVPLSVLAAWGVIRLWRTPWLRPLVGALAAWLVAGSLLAHPDYLPWMNAFAGPHPERVVLDSNFDWGQDVVRLRDACRRKQIHAIHVALFGTADLARIGLPPAQAVDPEHGDDGWYAVSESFIIPAQTRDPRAYTWLTAGRPFERVGTSIRLYEVESRTPHRRPENERAP